jgi:hypothetical protein
VKRRVLIGRTLILAGVAVWIVFAVVWLAGGHPEGGRYVPFHLAGVIPGTLLARWDRIKGWARRGS